MKLRDPDRRPARPLSALMLAALLAGCITPPSPALIASCRTSASVFAAPTAKARSLLVSTPGYGGYYDSYAGLLEKWRLDFVEFPAPGESGLVDRARLLPRGDPGCAPTRRFYFSHVTDTRIRYALTAPRGHCVAVEYDRAPAAEMRIDVDYVRVADHDADTYQAVRVADGVTVARVRDFAIRPGETTPVDCGRIVPGFPDNPVRFLLAHVADPR